MSGPGVAMKPARELAQVEQLDAGDARPDAGVRFPSRGARAFADVADKDEWIAGEIGVSRCYVSQLKSGKRRPSLDVTLAIEASFHIPPRWWKPDVAASNAHPLDDGGDEEQNGKESGGRHGSRQRVGHSRAHRGEEVGARRAR